MTTEQAADSRDSIEDLGTPLAFKVGERAKRDDRADPEYIRVRTAVRALTGMQKEALVWHEPTQSIWRMVSDEGPYLKGTDLAPFPLAFYTAGYVFALTAELLDHAEAAGHEIESLAVTSDHFYTMEGSALRGDMVGGARPIQVSITAQFSGGAEVLGKLAQRALLTSPAEAYMRESLRNAFALEANGKSVGLSHPRPQQPASSEPLPDFASIAPAEGQDPDNIIAKLSSAEVVHGVAGGAGSSLHAVQKRDLHVRGEARALSRSRKEIQVHLKQPIGSSFRFLGEDGGANQAPPALAYLAAGVGFCFMTQIGRYAHITKRQLMEYRVLQENDFHRSKPDEQELQASRAEAVATHVSLVLDEPDEVAQKIVSMGEQTCFLHAALRGQHPTVISTVDSSPGSAEQPGAEIRE